MDEQELQKLLFELENYSLETGELQRALRKLVILLIEIKPPTTVEEKGEKE